MLKWRQLLRLAQVKMVRMTEYVKFCTTHCISSDDWVLELCLARFEDLMDRRPLLLSSVLLRQNPHNVHEWHKRVALFENNPREVLLISSWFSSIISLCSLQTINAYTEAVQTVDISQAIGKPSSLWISFAKYYEDNDQLPEVLFACSAPTLFNKFIVRQESSLIRQLKSIFAQ